MTLDYDSWSTTVCSMCKTKLSKRDTIYEEYYNAYNSYCFKCKEEAEKRYKIKLVKFDKTNK